MIKCKLELIYYQRLYQYYNPSMLYIAKVIHDDTIGLTKHGLSGIIEDRSQRSFFPTGFTFYVHGETLFDSPVNFISIMIGIYSGNLTKTPVYFPEKSKRSQIKHK